MPKRIKLTMPDIPSNIEVYPAYKNKKQNKTKKQELPKNEKKN